VYAQTAYKLLLRQSGMNRNWSVLPITRPVSQSASITSSGVLAQRIMLSSLSCINPPSESRKRRSNYMSGDRTTQKGDEGIYVSPSLHTEMRGGLPSPVHYSTIRKPNNVNGLCNTSPQNIRNDRPSTNKHCGTCRLFMKGARKNDLGM